MNREIANFVNRIDIYLKRIRQDMQNRDPVQGMADSAELGEQARRLWNEFQHEAKRNGKTSD
jgi:hypothetical protein